MNNLVYFFNYIGEGVRVKSKYNTMYKRCYTEKKRKEEKEKKNLSFIKEESQSQKGEAGFKFFKFIMDWIRDLIKEAQDEIDLENLKKELEIQKKRCISKGLNRRREESTPRGEGIETKKKDSFFFLFFIKVLLKTSLCISIFLILLIFL